MERLRSDCCLCVLCKNPEESIKVVVDETRPQDQGSCHKIVSSRNYKEAFTMTSQKHDCLNLLELQQQ